MSTSSPARHVVAVASGKGGVGKSTVALNLALALHADGAAVGLLDADLYGPDIPRMVGLTRTADAKSWFLWKRGGSRLEPVERLGLRIMSSGFLLAERQAMPWAAPTLPFVLRQLIHDVEWGELDYLVIDLPPGTADLQQEMFTLLAEAVVLLVVGPQDVAHLDARKLVTLLEERGLAILGGVENMSGLTCPHCGEHVDVFARTPEARTIWTHGVPQLASIPFDPALGDAPRPEAFSELARTVAERLGA